MQAAGERERRRRGERKREEGKEEKGREKEGTISTPVLLLTLNKINSALEHNYLALAHS